MKEALEGVFRKKWEYFLRKNINGISIFSKPNIKRAAFIEDPNGTWSYILDSNIKFNLITGTLNELKEIENYAKLKKLRFFYLKPDILLWHKNWKEKNHAEINIWYLDIEAIHPEKAEFPDVFSGQIPITHIQILDKRLNTAFILMWKDISKKKKIELQEKYKDINIKFIICEDEYDLFKKFIKLLHKRKPTIITGWNAETFDFPYITIRAAVLGFDINDFSLLEETEFFDFKEHDRDKRKVKWTGTYLIDMMDAFKKFTFKDFKSYSLDSIVKSVLGTDKGKVDYGEDKTIRQFFINNYEKFTDYAIMDIILLDDLDKASGLMSLIQMMAEMMGTNYDNIFGTVRPWTDLLTHLALEEKMVVPNESEYNDHRPIVGGFVKDPLKGLHEWLFSYDYNSLYPSIQVSFNLSPDTYIDEKYLPKEAINILRRINENEDILLNNPNLFDEIEIICKKYNIEFGGLGFFKIDKQGILPKTLESFYYQRKEEKTKMLLAEAILSNKASIKMSVNEIIENIEKGEINWNNVYDIEIKDKQNIKDLESYINLKNTIQMALKININSEFGALDNKHFPVSNRNISGSITFIGRLLNRITGKNISEYLAKKFGGNPKDYWIYGDTDSGYLKLSNKIVYELTKSEFSFQSIEDMKYDELNIDDKRKFINIILDFINNEIQKVINDSIEYIRNKFNSFKKGFMGAKVEKIALKGFWTAKKRYALLVIYDEGSYYLEKPKIKVTGLETVRSSTPDYAINILEKALFIILTKNEKELQEYLEIIKSDFFKQKPTQICEVVKINKLQYQKDSRGYFRINEKGMRIGAPMNSKGGINYNELRKKYNLEEQFQEIEEGSKAYIAKLKIPNPENIDVIAFYEDEFLEEIKLDKYIDYEYVWEKFIITPLKTITDSISWNLERKNVIDIDEW